jgi:hypothetical protein
MSEMRLILFLLYVCITPSDIGASGPVTLLQHDVEVDDKLERTVELSDTLRLEAGGGCNN